MLVEPNTRRHASAHVVVLGNEKGGSGKSTTAMHVAVALMKAGQRVATIDLDSRQKSFTHYVENRRAWAKRAGVDLEAPGAFLRRARPTAQARRERGDRVHRLRRGDRPRSSTSHDFIVIDTPGTDTYLMRLAHSMADTLITPLNDSFVDFDVLGTVDPARPSRSPARATTPRWCARRAASAASSTATTIDWIVVRNRLSMLGSRNKRLVGEGLHELGAAARLPRVDGFAERVVYREFFPRGLTALDELDEATLGTRPSLSHVTAREEVDGPARAR